VCGDGVSADLRRRDISAERANDCGLECRANGNDDGMRRPGERISRGLYPFKSDCLAALGATGDTHGRNFTIVVFCNTWNSAVRW
jgi:hypothetical protein